PRFLAYYNHLSVLISTGYSIQQPLIYEKLISFCKIIFQQPVSEGYYISKEENEWIAGIGVTAALSFLEIIEIVINGNTIKGYGGGIIFRF
ncbi:MAG: hypothetical protein ABFD81_02155, partial [Syntrophaceae bacterium]